MKVDSLGRKATKKKYNNRELGQFFNGYIQRARRRNQEFSISFEHFKQLTTGKCVYCGCDPQERYYTNHNIKLKETCHMKIF